ncbi:DNA cytosine methyltransferase [Aquibacillus sp. 3ASR75-11]|uniref:DNA (cytosine-5-)-methyltransferase n=1 Tax=Terrihalobacillus insolitus TaxID=2950438 RepID=A0A9X4AM21_9BACI|nr:DNA cytosine methyltransferase [Terrihalobacillus insolitus]MDC3424374.1 DNA cytosine methyltransferase [Terrihalobacillus insolitus]
MRPIMKKVYTISKKAEQPRVWLQSLVCEAAGWKEGETLYVQVLEDKQEIIIENKTEHAAVDSHVVHVSGRKSPTSQKRRPLVDSSGSRYASILSIKQKVEICVFTEGDYGRVIIRPLQYKLMASKTIQSPADERIRLLSMCAGAGIGTSCMVDTNYFTPVMEIEWEDDSSEVIKHNYPNSYLFNGDLRDCNEAVKSDVAFISLPCDQHSSLGYQEGNVMNNLVLAASKLIKSSKSKILFFENVPQFYKSDSWFILKDLLGDIYPYWQEKNIESWDYGSIATRNRTYAVGFSDYELFQSFEFPRAPKLRRKKLKDYLESPKSKFEWKSLAKWMNSFQSRDSSWKNRSLDKTFVTGEVKQINAIPARYRSQCASNSYVLSENRESFRFLTEKEIRKILHVPDWFEFCDHTPVTRRYEMLGQSVDGNVIRAIANNIAMVLMKHSFHTIKEHVKEIKDKTVASVNIATNGQLELMI